MGPSWGAKGGARHLHPPTRRPSLALRSQGRDGVDDGKALARDHLHAHVVGPERHVEHHHAALRHVHLRMCANAKTVAKTPAASVDTLHLFVAWSY